MSKLEKIFKLRGIFAVFALLLSPSVFAQHYIQTNLVSSIPGVGTNPTNPLDAQLINSWGLARSTGSPWWIADNGTGVSTIYNGVGTKQSLVVTIPPPKGQAGPSKPTGVVFNGTSSDFLLSNGAAAMFIFVTEDGTIAGWNNKSGTTAELIPSSSKDAVYKGCTIAVLNGKHYLYVANFHSGEIEVYDNTFHRVVLKGKSFVPDDKKNGKDENDDSGPGFNGVNNFAPFNVQAIGTNVFVAYAKQDKDKEDDVPGAGLGAVIEFDAAGNRLARLQDGNWFNAPWGIAIAPGEFGEFSHSLLIGMFGSGQIAAFNPIDGSFLGLMKGPDDSILTIGGLWALGFGAGNANSGPYNSLFFTAGPNDENDGLFGTLVPTTPELTEADEP